MSEEKSTALTIPTDSLIDRRRQAYHMSIRGYKPDQIAKVMGKSTETIRKYLRDQRTLLEEANASVRAIDYISEIRESYALVRMEIWNLYLKCDNPKDKLKCLSQIESIRSKETKQLQSLGALDKTPEKVEHSHSHSVKSNHITVDISDERLDSLASILIGDKMGLEPSEVLAMGGGEKIYPGLPSAIIDAEYEEKELIPIPRQEEFNIDD